MSLRSLIGSASRGHRGANLGCVPAWAAKADGSPLFAPQPAVKKHAECRLAFARTSGNRISISTNAHSNAAATQSYDSVLRGSCPTLAAQLECEHKSANSTYGRHEMARRDKHRNRVVWGEPANNRPAPHSNLTDRSQESIRTRSRSRANSWAQSPGQ